MKQWRMVFVVGCLLMSGLWTAYSQGEDPIFMQANPDPLMERGAPGTWNSAYNDPGAVIFHDGQFHMFQNGFDGWPTTSGIGYYTSTDGINWEAQSDAPIFHSTDHEFEGFALVATSVIVTDEGEWRLYLTQLQGQSASSVRGVGIRLAVADDPLGEWTLLDEFLLELGSEDEWDQEQITDPMVVQTDTGYVMYFTGFSMRVPQIGMATSDDGIAWEKYDDPTTSESPFAESDPIMVRDLDWEQTVQYPTVVETAEGYVMIYMSRTTNGSSTRLGMALSQDGVNWEKYDDPIYSPSMIEENGTTFITALVYHDETYFLYVDGFVRSSFSLPYVLTHNGPLFPEN